MIADVKLSALMTTDVVSVLPGDSLEKVGQIFEQLEIHHLPVVDEKGKIVGMISKSDFEKINHALTFFNQEKYREYNLSLRRSLLASELMTRQLALLSPFDSVFMAADYFRENRFRAIPIVDDTGKLVGIITTYDLLNYAYQHEHLPI